MDYLGYENCMDDKETERRTCEKRLKKAKRKMFELDLASRTHPDIPTNLQLIKFKT